MPVRELSVFFPAFDEAPNIERTVTKALEVLGRLPLDEFEIVVVDDGSRDGTAEIADRLAARERSVRVIHHDGNRGYGAALRTGFSATRLPWVFFSDGDGQFDLSEISGFLQAAETAEVVVGYRIERADHLGRKVNTFLWGLLVKLAFRIPVRDIDCAFKLVSRDVLERIGPLTTSGAMISTEMLAQIRHRQIPIVEIGVHHYPRLAGIPSGANLRVIVRALRELVVLRAHMWWSPRADDR